MTAKVLYSTKWGHVATADVTPGVYIRVDSDAGPLPTVEALRIATAIEAAVNSHRTELDEGGWQPVEDMQVMQKWLEADSVECQMANRIAGMHYEKGTVITISVPVRIRF